MPEPKKSREAPSGRGAVAGRTQEQHGELSLLNSSSVSAIAADSVNVSIVERVLGLFLYQIDTLTQFRAALQADCNHLL